LRKNTTQSAAVRAQSALSREPQLAFSEGDSGAPARQDGRVPLRNTYRIELQLIEPDPRQPRQYFDEPTLQELADSIRARDIKQPLTVRWESTAGKYRIIDGERRYRAAALAGLADVPCLLEEADSRDTLIDQIVHNWQRADLRPYETADALIRLRDEFQMPLTEIATLTGKSLGEVSKLVALVDKVIPEVQKSVREVGEATMTKTHLYLLSQLEPDQQKRLAARIHREHLTVLETEKLIREGQEPPNFHQRHVGRPRKHVSLQTKYGWVRLSPDAQQYTDEILLAMLQEARRMIADKEFSARSRQPVQP
jgi:ParB family transcriptional regulator, chromosome partitioning protein